ncbi:MAG: 30S ribosome-binding factor RbfA [Candidatus Colwellbacteria bacterium]|nr:30S ribosome-binding factor RbfA [Candidatus Colwellbacteria bacterium]
MKPFRKEQLASLIQKELGEIIARHIEFPSGFLATISEVEVSKDFKKAVIWVGVIPGEMSGEVLETLKKARGYLQHQLGEEIRTRVIPRIEFEIDRGAEHAARIEKLSLEEKDK